MVIEDMYFIQYTHLFILLQLVVIYVLVQHTNDLYIDYYHCLSHGKDGIQSHWKLEYAAHYAKFIPTVYFHKK